MKYLLFFTIFFNSGGLLAQDPEIGRRLDSLLLGYIQENQVTLTPEELVGVYSWSESFFSQTIELKDNNTFIIIDGGCFGHHVGGKGKWKVDGKFISMDGKGKNDWKMIVIRKDGELALMSTASIARWKAYAAAIVEDYYIIKGEEGLENKIAEMVDMIDAQLYKR